MKAIFRLVVLALMLSGWVVAALCLNIIRTPDPNNPQQSKLVVIPKQRLGVEETYVDARRWTMADVPAHAALVRRILDADKADELKFLANPKSKDDVQTQLTDALAGKTSDAASTTGRSSGPVAGASYH